MAVVGGLHRRSLITGLISLIAAPAIVRASSLMPVKQMIREYRLTIRGFDQFGNAFTEEIIYPIGLNERSSYRWVECNSVIVG